MRVDTVDKVLGNVPADLHMYYWGGLMVVSDEN